jgi:tetratricopeptide (TPR) repeat protein
MMKKLVIMLLILVATGTAFPGFTALAQPAKNPHENPDIATGSLDKVSLLLNYSRLFFLASNRQYTDALDALEELRKIDIPDELRNIIDRFNDLCQQLFLTLDKLETILDETLTLLEHNKIDEARIKLDQAEAYIQQALIILEDLQLAMDIMSQRLGVFAASVSSDIREAYERLQESLKQLEQLLNMLAELRQSLSKQYFEKYSRVEEKEMLPTSITLSVNPTSVYIGDTVDVSGVLQCYDEPLAGRNVIITLDGDTEVTVTTREDGSYSGNITVPYKYQEAMAAIASYEPQGNDSDKYLACHSPEVTLRTMFYPTRLEISVPAIAYPGIPFNIEGEIISGENDIERTVAVDLDGTPITGTTACGQFSMEISLPDDVSPGQHYLTVTVPQQERYAGVFEQSSITVSLIPLGIDLETPNLIILPRSIQVSGWVRYEDGPISGAGINLVFNDISTTATTSADGSFTATLKVSLDISFIGQRELTINVEPLEPWLGSLSVKRQAIVINPVFTGLALVAAIALIIITTRRRRIVEEKDVPQEVVIRAPVFITPRVSAIRFTGIKGRIISAYQAILVIIEKITGVRMTPEKTLREFLAAVTKLLPGITRQLTELTVMAESALYSDHKPSRETASTAEDITDAIKKELQGGA